jgi:hypothetical protein
MVPQFPMVLHPVLLAALPVFPLFLITRLAPRPFSATLTAVLFTALRLLLAGWLMAASHFDLGGVSKPAIPLLIPTGLVADLMAGRDSKGWVSGAAAGAVTLLVNLAVIDLWGPVAGGVRLFWTAGTVGTAVVPALVLSAVMGAAVSAVAACFGVRTTGHPAVVRRAFVHTAIVAVVATGALASAAVPPADAAARSNSPVTARITIAHRSPGHPSLVTVQIDPPGAPRGGELLLSIYRPGVIVNRRVLNPAGPGVYRAEYVFPVDGLWRYYVRFGPGQAGFAGGGFISIANDAGTTDQARTLMRSGLRRAPPYVQTLGYAAFGLVAALALTGISIVLARMRLVYSPPVPS